MISFYTGNRQGYSVKFAPFNASLLAVVANEQFGLSGNGALCILHINQTGQVEEIANNQWPNGLFDVCWLAEPSSNLILTSSGDGYLQIWSLSENKKPVAHFLGYNQEVSSIDYNKRQFVSLILSASWDRTVKTWDANRYACLKTFIGHSRPVCEAKFSPQFPNIIASVSADGTLKLWSTLSRHNLIASIQAHDAEVLSCDWSKYHDNLIATSGSDTLIRCWDIRNHRQPLIQIKAGEQPVKQIRFSPHLPHILASASFDCSTQIWDIRQKRPLEVFQHHSGFVYGLDWNIHKIGELADCSWDSTVKVFKSEVIKNLKNKM